MCRDEKTHTSWFHGNVGGGRNVAENFGQKMANPTKHTTKRNLSGWSHSHDEEDDTRTRTRNRNTNNDVLFVCVCVVPWFGFDNLTFDKWIEEGVYCLHLALARAC